MVTKLNGEQYYINPHHIEYMESNPDLTLIMLSGKRLVVRENSEEIQKRIIAYRRKIGTIKDDN